MRGDDDSDPSAQWLAKITSLFPFENSRDWTESPEMVLEDTKSPISPDFCHLD